MAPGADSAPAAAVRRPGAWRTPAGLLLIAAATAAMQLSGLLRPLDDGLAGSRFNLLRREASQTLTVVEIDPPSIAAAGRWPWTRARFAQAIRNLQDAGAEVIAFDVDFSAASSPAADKALEDAVARRPGSVILPTFVQLAGRDTPGRMVENVPLAGVAQEAVLASVNVPVDSDGRVRRYLYGLSAGDAYRQSAATLLAGLPPGRSGTFLVDYGIRPSGIPHLSFEAAYSGAFDARLVKGRRILVGSTAQELGDDFATPQRGTLPGVYVHALAYESALAGRDLKQLNPLLVLGFAGWAIYLLRPRITRDLRKMLRRHAGVGLAAIGGPLALQALTPIVAGTAAVLLAQLLCLIWLLRHELARRAQAVVEAREAHLVQLAEHMRESRDSIRAAHDELQVVNAALDKALRARTDFLAMTSHEIRTPLNGVMGMTQVILADRNLPEGVRQKVKLVHASGETMLALVDDILDVAKMESGNLTISPDEMDLHKLLSDTVQLWTDKASSKGLKVRSDWTGTPVRIVEDSGRLRQILFNLASNAIKFTEAGDIGLRGRVETSESGDVLVLEVSDTGIGIPQERVEHIFEAFAQVDSTVTRKYGGTGLGLAISRRLAQAMGGDLTVETALGEGSRFILRLPLRLAAGHSAAADAANAAGLGSASVLLVEANPLAQAVLKAALSGKIDALQIAASAAEAATALGAARFDLLLIDGKALVPDAGDAPKGLEGLVRQGRGARVVVLWAGRPEEAPLLAAAGADRVILKPIATADLVQELDAVCRPREGGALLDGSRRRHTS